MWELLGEGGFGSGLLLLVAVRCLGLSALKYALDREV